MKNNKVMKILSILLIVAFAFMAFSQVALATDGFNLDSSTNIFAHKQDTSGASNAAVNIIGSLINIFQIVGMGVAIIFLIWIAIKYISASPDGKAEVKKSSTQYIVGSIVLFSAAAILQIIKKFALGNVKAE